LSAAAQATYVAQDNIRLLSRDAGGADAAVVDGDDDASVQHPYVSAPAAAAVLRAVQTGSGAARQPRGGVENSEH